MSETSDSTVNASTAIPYIPPDPIDVPQPRTGHLKDCITPITIYPIQGGTRLPEKLVIHLWNEFNDEIRDGNTYPMENMLSFAQFKSYWMSIFCAIMLKGSEPEISEERDWATECLGTFYIKPNYPGRCNHICNGGFMVCKAFRNRGAGKLLGEAYIDYATKLGYKSSLFNLVFETNPASWMIWDKLGFQRLAVLPAAGRLNCSDELVNAIIFRKDLSPDAEYVSTQRFKKIKYYLTTGKYPPNADRAEKSRLRSAATHYSIETDGAKTRLFLRDKEVIDEEFEQYDVARRIHSINHGGINKTTALVSEKYHWTQIKSTVMKVVKNCPECIENTKGSTGGRTTTSEPSPSTSKSSSPAAELAPLGALSNKPAMKSSQPLRPLETSTTIAPAETTIQRQPPSLAPATATLSSTSVGPEIFQAFQQPQPVRQPHEFQQMQAKRIQDSSEASYPFEMTTTNTSLSTIDIPIDPQIQSAQHQQQQQQNQMTHPHRVHPYSRHSVQSPQAHVRQLYQSSEPHQHQQGQFQSLGAMPGGVSPSLNGTPFTSIVATAQSALRHHSARTDQPAQQLPTTAPETIVNQVEDDQFLQAHLRQYTVDRELDEGEVSISEEVAMEGLDGGSNMGIGSGGVGEGVSGVEGTQFDEATASMVSRGSLLSSVNNTATVDGMFGGGIESGISNSVEDGEGMDLDHQHQHQRTAGNESEGRDGLGDLTGEFNLRNRT